MTLKKKLRQKALLWIDKHCEKELDRKKLSFKIKMGLILIALSFVVGWGLAAAMEIIAIWADNSKFFIVAGVVCYVSSWGIWALGMFFTGKANYEYAQFFLAKYLKKKGVFRS